ncbi:MAG TPA: hypothetical protein VMI30_11540 [Stellaceae bacterium]|nr:hypothetical protein [Stellaceae bacterium]
MSRFGGAFWFILVVASGMTNFLVKHTVQGLDDQLASMRKKTVAEQKSIHDLTTDWTFLNQPELLADLNNRYVHLASPSPKQILTSVDSIPLRPAPPPVEPEALPQIAEAAPVPPVPAPTLASTASTNPAPIMRVAAVSTPGASPASPLSVISVAEAATRPPPARAPHPAKPASLDNLFAQVVGGR